MKFWNRWSEGKQRVVPSAERKGFGGASVDWENGTGREKLDLGVWMNEQFLPGLPEDQREYGRASVLSKEYLYTSIRVDLRPGCEKDCKEEFRRRVAERKKQGWELLSAGDNVGGHTGFVVTLCAEMRRKKTDRENALNGRGRI